MHLDRILAKKKTPNGGTYGAHPYILAVGTSRKIFAYHFWKDNYKSKVECIMMLYKYKYINRAIKS